MKIITVLICGAQMGALHAGVGSIDGRQYVNWSDAPYNKIVLFDTGSGFCTAQYVARDIILTARHCVTDTRDFDRYKNLGQTFEFKTHDGRFGKCVLEKYGRDFKTGDWAVLRVVDAAFYSNDYFNVANKTSYGPISVAGFGFMRILTDAEIRRIREIFSNTAKSRSIGETDFFALWDASVEQLRAENIYLDDTDAKTGHPRLKADLSCEIKRGAAGSSARFISSCDTMQGNSGGPYFYANELRGIVSGGINSFDDDIKLDIGVRSAEFVRVIKSLATSVAAPQTQPTPVSQPSQPATPVIQSADSATQPQIDRAATQMGQRIKDVDKMSDRDFLKFLGDGVGLQVLRENYERARAREQSLAARLVGAAAIAGGGIGAMQMMSGMAEEAADAAAERDMAAYLATFVCDYGMGKNIQGGTRGIELPGGNDLMELRREYDVLARRVRQMKNTLNMAPGVESESIAERDLYENESIGRTGGAFMSVANALMDANSADAAEFQAQKDSAKSKTKTGATIGGIGIGVGIIGNIVTSNTGNKSDGAKSDTK